MILLGLLRDLAWVKLQLRVYLVKVEKNSGLIRNKARKVKYPCVSCGCLASKLIIKRISLELISN